MNNFKFSPYLKLQCPLNSALFSNEWEFSSFPSEWKIVPDSMQACMLGIFSRVQFFVTLWTVAHQAPLSRGFPRQEYWSELPLPSPGYLPDPGIEPQSPVFAGRFFTAEPPGKPINSVEWLLTRVTHQNPREPVLLLMMEFLNPLAQVPLQGF